MGYYSTRYKICICILLAQPLNSAHALDNKPIAPLDVHAKYAVAWNGITIGRILFTGKEEPTRYHLTVDTKTHGIGSMFSKEKRVSTAEGTRAGDRFTPIRYDSRPQKDEEGRRTTLLYDASGNITSRERVPDDNPAWRPVVPDKDINNAHDTTTAGFALRRQLYNAIQKGGTQSSVRAYDGARLAEISVHALKAETRVEVMGNYVPVINTIVTRTPINGYTPKELKKFKAGDPEIHLYFTADEQFLPVRATVDTVVGQLSATLVETK